MQKCIRMMELTTKMTSPYCSSKCASHEESWQSFVARRVLAPNCWIAVSTVIITAVPMEGQIRQYSIVCDLPALVSRIYGVDRTVQLIFSQFLQLHTLYAVAAALLHAYFMQYLSKLLQHIFTSIPEEWVRVYARYLQSYMHSECEL